MKKKVKILIDNITDSRLFHDDYQIRAYEWQKYKVWFFYPVEGWICIQSTHSSKKEDIFATLRKWEWGYDVTEVKDVSHYNGKDDWSKFGEDSEDNEGMGYRLFRANQRAKKNENTGQ